MSGAPVGYFSAFVEGRRGQILDAALEVFAEKGYDGGTMREIAAKVGVTEPALYRHYAGKEALFEELVALTGDHIVGMARALMADVRADDLRASILRLIEARRQAAREAGGLIVRMLLVAAPHSGLFLDTVRAHLTTPMTGLLDQVVPLVDAAHGLSFTAEETATRVRLVTSLFIGHFMTSMVLGTGPSDEATADAIMKLMDWTDA